MLSFEATSFRPFIVLFFFFVVVVFFFSRITSVFLVLRHKQFHSFFILLITRFTLCSRKEIREYDRLLQTTEVREPNLGQLLS